jgi:hypothetical protein
MEFLLVLAAAATGIGLYTGTLYAREGIEEMQRLPGWVKFIGALMLPGQIALVILGLFFFKWWIWVAILAFSLLVLGRFASQALGIVIYGVAPFLNIFALVATTFGWLRFLEIL